MISMVLFGFGNVGQQLYKVFKKKKVNILQVYSPSMTPIEKKGTKFINDLAQVEAADIYIVAINDDAINNFSSSLPFENALVVHTSGSASIESIVSKNRRGVFYPLQTFSKDQKVKWKDIPICIEAENEADLSILKELGNLLSRKVVVINSEQRKQLHLGAVWVNNFSNHLFHLADDFLGDVNLDFNLLKPLILETAKKIKNISPAEAQTGPARRNDQETITNHLALLKNPNHKELYDLLTKSIREKFK